LCNVDLGEVKIQTKRCAMAATWFLLSFDVITTMAFSQNLVETPHPKICIPMIVFELVNCKKMLEKENDFLLHVDIDNVYYTYVLLMIALCLNILLKCCSDINAFLKARH
jgi:hypothetical protein